MSYIFPEPLKKGDTIGIIAPCGSLKDPERIKTGTKLLQNAGFKVKLSEHLFDKYRYMAGRDNIRGEEINNFFADKEINCIICARGGYGALRIIDKLDYDLIKHNPKLFCGYSDVTALSVMLLKHAGLVTYSSPMLSGDLGEEKISDFTINEFFKTLGGKQCEYGLTGSSENSTNGIAWGGNLTTITSLCGRDFIPDEKFVFIIEDINEPAYKIDRCLAQLGGIKRFRDNVAGIVCGEFTGIDNAEWLDETIKEYSEEFKVPLWTGLKLGHIAEKITFPIGGECEVKRNRIFFKQRG